MRVVYGKDMNAPAQGYSPSAAKPAAVMREWVKLWPSRAMARAESGWSLP